MPKAILNYTTSISVDKTLGEIMSMLAKSGARSLQVDYDQGSPVGIQFLIATKFGDRGFQLPANVEGVNRTLRKQYDQRVVQLRFTTKDQAARVAWRIIKDWLEAQLALIEAGMAQLEEVMLPWMLHDSGQTLFQFMESHQLALPAGKARGNV